MINDINDVRINAEIFDRQLGKSSEIKPVSNNDDKRRTYQVLKGKLARVLREKFYFEAMLIDYALMEDRLRSYLYYMGILTDRTQTRINSKIKAEIISIVDLYKKGDDKTTLKINCISRK